MVVMEQRVLVVGCALYSRFKISPSDTPTSVVVNGAAGLDAVVCAMLSFHATT